MREAGEKKERKGEKKIAKNKNPWQLIAVLTFWHFDVLTAGTLAYLAHFVARICLTNCLRPFKKKEKRKKMEGTNCYEACINKNCAGLEIALPRAG